MRMRGPTASFLLALLIVGSGTVGVLVAWAAHPGESSEWPLIAVPIWPAFLLAYVLGGGPHGNAGEWWFQVPVTFVVALAMWWAVLEGCRRLWNFGYRSVQFAFSKRLR